MAKVVIKTPDGRDVGGGTEPEIVDSLSRAYLYDDCPATDAQVATVNTMFNLGWSKADAEEELRRVRRGSPGWFPGTAKRAREARRKEGRPQARGRPCVF
jgi:hypothetical protein